MRLTSFTLFLPIHSKIWPCVVITEVVQVSGFLGCVMTRFVPPPAAGCRVGWVQLQDLCAGGGQAGQGGRGRVMVQQGESPTCNQRKDTAPWIHRDYLENVRPYLLYMSPFYLFMSFFSCFYINHSLYILFHCHIATLYLM